MPRNKYPEETVQKILDVSLKLFLEKGYEQTTVLDIVANMGGLTRGAFYHHFKSKEDVLDAIFSRYLNENDPFERARQTKGINGLERTRLALKLSLQKNLEGENPGAIPMLSVSLLSNPRFLAEQIKSNQKTAAILAPMIEEGMQDGSIKPGTPNVVASLFMLLTNFWMFPAIFPCNMEETIAKGEMIDQILEAIGFPVVDEEMEQIFMRVFDFLL